MSVARVWALPGLGGMGGLRAEFAAGTETPHPSHRKKQALPAVHPNSKPCTDKNERLTERAYKCLSAPSSDPAQTEDIIEFAGSSPPSDAILELLNSDWRQWSNSSQK